MATYIQCFFLTLMLFCMFRPYIHICLYYFLILCSYFHVPFLTLLATRHILLLTIFDSISLQPARNTTELRKTLYGWRRKKKCHAGYNQNKCSNIWYKVWVFPPTLFISHSRIILWILNNIPYRTLSQHCKQHIPN